MFPYFIGLHAIIPAHDAAWNSFAGLWTISMFVIYYILAPFLSKIKDSRTCCCSTCVFMIISIAMVKIGGLFAKIYFSGNTSFIDRSILIMLPVFMMGQTMVSVKYEGGEYSAKN